MFSNDSRLNGANNLINLDKVNALSYKLKPGHVLLDTGVNTILCSFKWDFLKCNKGCGVKLSNKTLPAIAEHKQMII